MAHATGCGAPELPAHSLYGRAFVIAPQFHDISFSDKSISDLRYYFYLPDSLEDSVQKFYEEKDGDANLDSFGFYTLKQYKECIIVFNSEDEQRLFESYVSVRGELYRELKAAYSNQIPKLPEIQGYNMEGFKKELSDAMVLQKMLSEYRADRYRSQ